MTDWLRNDLVGDVRAAARDDLDSSAERTPCAGADPSGRDDARGTAAYKTGTAVPALDRAPVEARSAIHCYWADGLDARTIAERLASHGVTVHHVLVERYLHPAELFPDP
jgi:hypothetical protein